MAGLIVLIPICIFGAYHLIKGYLANRPDKFAQAFTQPHLTTIYLNMNGQLIKLEK
jgi:hypothetical protein